MAITLATTTQAARAETSYSVGTDTFVVPAGKSLKVETSPRGDDILDIEVPSGKSWIVTVDVAIAETNA